MNEDILKAFINCKGIKTKYSYISSNDEKKEETARAIFIKSVLLDQEEQSPYIKHFISDIEEATEEEKKLLNYAFNERRLYKTEITKTFLKNT